MRLQRTITALSLLTAGSIVGVAGQHVASADVSAGDRPVLVPIEPCRLADTRAAATVGPKASPLGPGETHTIDVQGPGTGCTGDVPAAASSLALNVTSVGATQQTFLTIWSGGPRPLASSLNPSPGAPPTPNAVTVELSPAGTFDVYNEAGSVDVLVDVVGYYEHHDHDDRYYTEPEVDAALATKADAGLAPLVFGRIDPDGSPSFHSGLLASSTWNAGAQRYELSIQGEDFTTSRYVTTASPHCGSNVEPMVNVSSVGGQLLVTIFDDDPVADDVPTQCAFSFVVYADPTG